VKLNRSFLAIAMVTACVISAGSAFAGSGCPDDPERCVERGATVIHRGVVVAPATVVPSPPAHAQVATAPAHKAPAPAPKSKSVNKAARISPAAPAPATPGMGMLLKLSNGTAGEVSLFPGKLNDTTSGASWVL
jgi:hypothetical protein